MAVEDENEGAAQLTVRQKAEQDLAVVRERRRDVERRFGELRQEEAFLTQFIERLKRYDPDPDPDEQEVSHSRPQSLEWNRHRYMGRTSDGASAGHRAYGVAAEAIRRHAAAISAARPKVTLEHLSLSSEPIDNSGNAVIDVTKPVPSPTSRRGQVNGLAHSLASGGGFWTTKFLVECIRAKPAIFEFLGTRPEATLSSYLSRDPRFRFDRDKGGWEVLPSPDADAVDQDGGASDVASKEGGVS